MLCCGFSTSRLRKFAKFRGLLVLSFVAFSIVVILRSGKLFPRAQRNGENDQDILWQDSSGKSNDALASGSGQRNKQKMFHTRKQSLRNLEQNLEKIVTSGKMKDTEIGSAKPKTKIDSIKITEKSYLELVDRINPSHSLQNDKSYPVNKLKMFTQSMNEHLIVFNKDKFPKRPKHGPVVVVQVHKRLEYLVHLLSSLEKAKGIQDVLLIISSDWFSDAIMNAVKQIKFCQV